MFLEKDLPCIKDKCLLIPVCKSKSTIHCTSLFNYIYKVTKPKKISYEIQPINFYTCICNKMILIFPHIIKVSRENGNVIYIGAKYLKEYD